MSRVLKVAYNGDVKKVLKNITKYPELESYVRTSGFAGTALPPKFKFYYKDSTDDVICISNDEELQNCLQYEELEVVRLVIAANTEMA